MSLSCLQWLADDGHDLVIFARPWSKPLTQQFKPAGFVPLTGQFRLDLKTIRQFHGTRPKLTHGLVLPDSLSSAALFYLSGIPSAGYRDECRSLLLRWAINKPALGLHASQKWWHLTQEAAKRWGLAKPPAYPPPVTLSISAEDAQSARQLICAAGLEQRPFILLAPTATGLHKGNIKIWPHFARLTAALQSRGYRLVICPPTSEITQAQLLAPGAQLVGPLNLGAFAALAQQSALVICNDSGISHLSAVAGAKQITLVGVTDPAQTGPMSDEATVLGHLGKWPTLDTVLAAVEREMAVPAPLISVDQP
jgi:heptosyltransferase-2